MAGSEQVGTKIVAIPFKWLLTTNLVWNGKPKRNYSQVG